MKIIWFLLLIFPLTACSEPKEPRFITVTNCVSTKTREAQVCNSPLGEGAAWAVGGFLMLGPIGLLAGAPSASGNKRCHMEQESYCERYETSQIANKNYKGD